MVEFYLLFNSSTHVVTLSATEAREKKKKKNDFAKNRTPDSALVTVILVHSAAVLIPIIGISRGFFTLTLPIPADKERTV